MEMTKDPKSDLCRMFTESLPPAQPHGLTHFDEQFPAHLPRHLALRCNLCVAYPLIAEPDNKARYWKPLTFAVPGYGVKRQGTPGAFIYGETASKKPILLWLWPGHPEDGTFILLQKGEVETVHWSY